VRGHGGSHLPAPPDLLASIPDSLKKAEEQTAHREGTVARALANLPIGHLIKGRGETYQHTDVAGEKFWIGVRKGKAFTGRQLYLHLGSKALIPHIGKAAVGQEAVTRTNDGKFATQGPCPESGCGRERGHAGAHKQRQSHEITVAPQWTQVASDLAHLPVEDQYGPAIMLDRILDGAKDKVADLMVKALPSGQLMEYWGAGGNVETTALRIAARSLWGGEVFSGPAPLDVKQGQRPMSMDEQKTAFDKFTEKRARVARGQGSEEFSSQNELLQGLRYYLQAQHAWTQEILRKELPEGSITLYRGMQLPDRAINTLKWVEGQDVHVKVGALSSFTSDLDTAKRFGNTIIEIKMPTKQIVSSLWSGMGRFDESEFVVAGDAQKFAAKIVKAQRPLNEARTPEGLTLIANLDAIDLNGPDWLHRDRMQQEAVTRTQDGKFASQGPCPESGCGRGEGHAGSHGPRHPIEREVAVDPAWRDQVRAAKARAITADAGTILLDLVRTTPEPNPLNGLVIQQDWRTGSSFGELSLRVAASTLWGGEVFSSIWTRTGIPAPLRRDHWPEALDEFRKLNMEGDYRPERLLAHFQDYLQAQHALTQSYDLGDPTKDTVTLYRGVSLPIKGTMSPGRIGRLLQGWAEGKDVEVKLGALSSFSERRDIAESFGPIVLEIQVPKNHIVANYRTGLGVEREKEWVVAGDQTKFKAKILRMPSWWKTPQWTPETAATSMATQEAVEDLTVNLDELDQDWLRRRTHQEAVTRDADGKFASQGPCPESGCGRGEGHTGAHGPRHPIERDVTVDPEWTATLKAMLDDGTAKRPETTDSDYDAWNKSLDALDQGLYGRLDQAEEHGEPGASEKKDALQWFTLRDVANFWAGEDRELVSRSLRQAARELWGGAVFSSAGPLSSADAYASAEQFIDTQKQSQAPDARASRTPGSNVTAALGEYLKGQHAWTQMLLARAPDTITLYRGIMPITKDKYGLLRTWRTGGKIDVKLGALSSFTTERAVAEEFGVDGWVLEVKVPKEYVVATHRTGLGHGGQKEWVVAGDLRKFAATVLSAPREFEKALQRLPKTATEAVEPADAVNLDALDQDWLRRRTQQEAVTRDADGKFASQGPCPESGCGRRDGHTGAHGPTSDGDLPDASGWEPVGGTAATHTFHGGFYRAPSGQVYYVKGAADDEHLRIEALANRLYRQAGVPVAKGFLVQQGDALRYASERVSGSSVDEADVAHHPDVMAGFGVDAWLGAWDVAGMDFSNLILTPDGHIVRVDHGGSLHRRAQGGVKKPMQWTAAVPELASLRNRDLNPGAGAMFEGMRQEDMARAIARVVERISDAAIDRHVAAVGLPAKDATILKARRATLRTWLQDHGVTVSEAVTRTQDGKFASNGPCAETGCGFAKGHKGAHAARWTHEGTEAEALAAIQNTPGAKIGPEGITLDIARFQNPEQAGAKALRTGVFYLPELKSPYRKYYSGDKAGYGGSQFVTNRATLQNPLIIKAGTGGTAIVKAYDLLLGKGAYEAMRSDVLKSTVSAMLPMIRTNPNGSREERLVFWGALGHEQQTAAVANLLTRYGGAPALASDIVRHSTQGNTLAYALQEHIAAFAIRKAGYDSVLSYSKAKGQPRLAEVFHLGHTHYPTVSLSRIGMREALEDLDDDLTWDEDPPWWVVEAITRTQDGKFASQGPCPESGCGRERGHQGAHRPKQATVERDVVADPEWTETLKAMLAEGTAARPTSLFAKSGTTAAYEAWSRSMDAITLAIRERADQAGDRQDRDAIQMHRVFEWKTPRDLSNHWVESSLNNASMGLRQAARELWGGEVFDATKPMSHEDGQERAFISVSDAQVMKGGRREKNIPGATVTKAFGEYLKAQHAWTQILLKSQPDEITLYRGVTIPIKERKEGLLAAWRPGAHVDVKVGALSSFSSDPGIANQFGEWMLKVTIPKEHVVGINSTGLGSPGEAEWVVAGDLRKFKAEVMKVPTEMLAYQGQQTLKQQQAKTATEAIEADADVVNLDELDQDWLMRARAQAQQEAVTRTEDGKFASNGPCSEFGCGKNRGHLGNHDTLDVPHKGERPVEPDPYWMERIQDAFAAERVRDPLDDGDEDEEDLVNQADNARKALATLLQGADDVNPDLLQVLGERQFAGSWEVGSARYITQTLRGAAQALWGGEVFSGTAGTLGKVLGPNEISLAATQEAAVATAKTDGKASFDAEGVMHHATKYLQAQHAWTQTLLADRGYADPDDPVYLFRAIHLPDRHRNLLKGWENGKMVRVKVGALSSLTEDEQTARSFGPLVLKIRVPRRYVVGTSTLGLGDTEEYEWVVAGDNKKFHAQILRMPSAWPVPGAISAAKAAKAVQEAQDEAEDAVNLDAFDPDWLRRRWLRRETATAESLAEYIVKVADGYRIISHETGKNLGTFKTRKAAEKHLRHLAQFREAVTRTQDGKFATQGPCPESGCGRGQGHGGAHGPAHETEARWHIPTAEQFIAARNQNTRAGFLSPLTPEGLADRRLVMGYGGKVGYALDPQGDIENVFSNDQPGGGREALFHAISQGGVTLDCFDGYLPELYTQYGFHETGRVRFNREYAPPGWNYDKYDDPDVVMMAWEGYPHGEAATRQRLTGPKDDWLTRLESHTYFPDWDAAKADSRGAVRAGHRVAHEGRSLGESARGVDPGAGARAGGSLAEAVTRTHDGKFASQGPCPESGCGRDRGHEGAHRDRETLRPADYQPAPRFATVEEMEDWLKATYPDLQTGRFFRDAENYNPEAVGKIVATFHDLAQRFPDVAAQIKELTVAGPWDDDLGWSLNAFAAAEYVPKGWGGSRITFNPGFLNGERGDLEAKSTKARNTGWLAVAGVEGVMAHEFGHIVQGYYEGLHDQAITAVTRANGFGNVAETVKGWTHYMLANQSAPSDYAKTNDKEMFAETFSTWHALTSGNESRLGSRGMTSRAVGTIDDLLRAVASRRTKSGYVRDVPQDQRDALYQTHVALAKSLGLPEKMVTGDWLEIVGAMKGETR
jgi:hypothetical protein